MSDLRWRNVSRREPCPVCTRPDWCSLSDDGVWVTCRRVADGGRPGVDSAGLEYWTHQVGDRPRGERWEPQPRPPAAPPEVLDRVYRALLADLALADEHRGNLAGRGLDEAAIAAGGYRSLPLTGRAALASRLAERFDKDTLMTVPGVGVRRDGDRTWLSFGGPAGLVVPVRSAAGDVVALKVRADEAFQSGGRYCYVSSARYDGRSPEPAVHVPVWDAGHTDVVRVTEGELKADVAAHLSGIRTISAPGVGGWRAVLPVLEQLGAAEVWLAFDRDWPPNPHVRDAIARFGADLHSRYAGGVEVWPHTLGKGIDDLMGAGGTTRLVGFPHTPPIRDIQVPARQMVRELNRG